MNNFEVKRALESMTILVDTREQDTPAFRRRMRQMETPYERIKLDAGDYSCSCLLPDGVEYSLMDKVAVERKMSADELCLCFGKERQRFQREFERAANTRTRLYLLVEDTSWEQLMTGDYRSKLNPDALIASILVWTARYNTNVIFCESSTSGVLIKKILRYELKERLENGEAEHAISGTA